MSVEPGREEAQNIVQRLETATLAARRCNQETARKLIAALATREGPRP